MQALTSLNSISPIDGRYYQATQSLSTYFSEFALFKYRVKVEVEYFLALCRLNLPQLPVLTTEQIQKLQNIYLHFNETEALKIKEIEKVTNHDIKAVEYYLKYKFDEIEFGTPYKEFIHFGLTSQDINNTAIPLSLERGL
jgi:adenylosuccinate lyase